MEWIIMDILHFGMIYFDKFILMKLINSINLMKKPGLIYNLLSERVQIYDV